MMAQNDYALLLIPSRASCINDILVCSELHLMAAYKQKRQTIGRKVINTSVTNPKIAFSSNRGPESEVSCQFSWY